MNPRFLNLPIKFMFMVFMLMFFLSTGTQAAELSTPVRKLNNTQITYNYTTGRSYNVKFEETGVSYRYLSGSKPEKWWGPFPYKAFEVEDRVFMVSWFEAGYGDYVTLLINLNNHLLYGSAILEGNSVHFHGAKIIDVKQH